MKEKFYFEHYREGDQYKTVSYTVSKEDIIEFAKKWDPQPFHIDEAAAKASIFGGLTACSAHIFAIYCITSQQWENGVEQQALASLGFDEMRMHMPVFAGDTVYCLNKVEMVRESTSKPDRGIVATRCELINQRGEVVFSILSTYLMKRLSPSPSP